MQSDGVSFLAFFLEWARFKGWHVPDFHVLACDWLEHRGDHAVMRMSRGFAKSTLLGCYNAWRFWQEPGYRILHQGDQDSTAYKTSRDTKAILQRHPWVRRDPESMHGEVQMWWLNENDDQRNPSMQARGIMSNVTSSRADEVQNDDVEVPRNIQTPEARETLRYRLSEQTHILVPEGRKLFVGTPHTHDSLYDEEIKGGADTFTVRLFKHEYRDENGKHAKLTLPFRAEYVFAGIHKGARLLEEGKDYRMTRDGIEFPKPPGVTIDCYAGCAWPERFSRKELLKRRRETRTLNEWDSQYQLHSKPIGQVRLDPDRMIPYDVEPRIEVANRAVRMWLGNAQIVSASLWADPSSGKLHSDAFSVSLVLQDAKGNLYWHRAVALTGEFAEFDRAGQIVGGYVMEICDVIAEFQIPTIRVETNGIGGHVPSILRGALKARGLQCGVLEEDAVTNKNKRILGAFEPVLTSGLLWAHVSVIEAVTPQMREWNPAVQQQPDDHLDSGAGAISSEPVRVGRIVLQPVEVARREWRPAGGVVEYEVG